MKESKGAYKQLGYDSIIAIWCSFKEAEDPNEWLSAEMRKIHEDLSQYHWFIMVLNFITDHRLESIRSFLDEQLSKNKVVCFMFSRPDVKINEYREHLEFAKQRFEVRPSSVKLSKNIFGRYTLLSLNLT